MGRFIKIFITLFLLGFFYIHPPPVYSTILFQDNFDNATESATKWEVIGPQMYNGDDSPANWTFKDGMYGMTINNRGSQFNESVPAGTNWNDSWKNYIFEVDFVLGEGPNPSYKPVDTNLVFRYFDHGEWYGIHGINSEKRLVLQKAGQTWSTMPSERTFWYEYNVPYRIKIRVENDHIVVSIRNKVTDVETLLWDIIDPGTILDHGKPGLQASTGANPYCDVWFDNVVVTSLDEVTGTPTPTPTSTPAPTNTPTPTCTPTPTPTPTPPTPVVFLPGLGGSINFKEMFLGISDPGGWRMTPGARVYDNLLKAFEGNSNFYVFYYDWRKPVLETAQKLNDYIHTTVNPWNNKVDLVGHSLGGLVARTCIQKTINNCYADKLITVGSPNFGAVDAYPALEGGEIWKAGISKLGYELFIHYFQQPGEIRKETIQRIAPVLKDLLPNFDYLLKNGTNLPPSALSFQNSLLPNLSDLSSLINLTKTITGRGFNSIEQIILTEPNWIDKLLGNWPDGKPADKQLTTEGDTSVLVKSSSFTNPLIKNFTYNLNHGGIISEQVPLTKIMEILGLELKPGTYNSLTDEENFLVFFVHSPVKISSPDTTPDSYATDELIIIPSPTNKNYTLNVEGTGSGFYSLSVGQIGTQSASWQDYYGEAQTGIKQNFEFDINIENPPEDPLANNLGFYSSEFDSLLNQCKNLTNSQITNPKYKNIILSLLNLISKEKNNPEMALNYVNLLRNSIATLEKQGNLNSPLANQLREYSFKMTSYLEKKAFDKPKITSKTQAGDYFNSAKTMLDQMEALHNFSKTATLIFLEAKEKLSETQNYLNLNQYYQTKILAKNIIGLLLEVKILSR